MPTPTAEVSAIKTWPAETNTPNNSNNVVQVENISAHVDINKIVSLFNTLIGGIKSFQYRENALGGHLEIAFVDQKFASKALCMTGCFVHGMKLLVSLSPSHTQTKRQVDGRRNLYVLGLPFSLTKAEFTNIFSRYGAVTHCVILATVDNSSRRRGFVVMSTHEEARLAMASLSQAQVKGHSLDVSWAVVQRSKGFLDGDDRALPLDNRCFPSSSSLMCEDTQNANSANSSATSLSSSEPELASLVLSPAPSHMLLVMDLPKLLFSQLKDLHPLLCPFGLVKRLSFVEAPSDGSTSVFVEYGSASVAQEAKEMLHGQHYAGHRLAVHFVLPESVLDHATSFYDDMIAPRTFDYTSRQSFDSVYSARQQFEHFNTVHHTGYRAPPPPSFDPFRLCNAFAPASSRYRSALKFGRIQLSSVPLEL